MRVLLFRTVCDTGGVSTWMLQYARELRRRGVACEFWFSQRSSRYAEFEAMGGATVGRVADLVPRVERGDFDVLHLPASDPQAELVAPLAGNARVIVTSRGALADYWTRRDCFAYTAVSQDLATLVQPDTELEVEAIPNGLDAAKFWPPETVGSGRPIVAWVGRSTAPEKDFPRFARIVRELRAADVRAWVADAHEGRARQVEMIKEYAGLFERWERLPHEQMGEFYRTVAASGGVVVMTSLHEGFGQAASEALGCGAAVVAPNVLGLREILSSELAGALYAANASDLDVAAVVRQCLATGGGRERMRARADWIQRRYSMAEMTEHYLAVYSRREQRLVTRPPRVDAPWMESLRAQYELGRTLRAEWALRGAVTLAAEGYADHARHALRVAWRARPSTFATRAAMLRVGETLLRMGRRPQRVLRRRGPVTAATPALTLSPR